MRRAWPRQGLLARLVKSVGGFQMALLVIITELALALVVLELALIAFLAVGVKIRPQALATTFRIGAVILLCEGRGDHQQSDDDKETSFHDFWILWLQI